ncbi:MAG: DnaA regulatory inactivator Hda [Gammaproteobacteria bacterium]|jgi:DnaA family protein|nr:DnaA regulatory inactivator Hda [Gammaproteobacteria bacterium]
MNLATTDLAGQQLTLNMRLPSYANWHNYDFAASPGVLPALQKIAQDPATDVLLLQGADGVGKSHLLQATAQAAMDHGWQVGYLSAAELLAMGPDTGAEMLAGFEQFQLLCIDDIDALCQTSSWCEALFHLYNANQQLGHRLLLSSSQTARTMPCLLPDLQSRLQLALMMPLHALDEARQGQQLIMRARQLGFSISTELAQYICLHSQRNMGAVMTVLQTLDTASWQAKRKLTIPFVKQTMQW